MPETTHISSLLLRADPAKLDPVVAEIEANAALEVAVADPSGKIIVALETQSESEIVDHLNQLSLIEGVVSTWLVFHQAETEVDAPVS